MQKAIWRNVKGTSLAWVLVHYLLPALGKKSDGR